MPANTPIYNFPYPLGTDPVSQGDNDIRALAEDVETVISTNVATLTSSIPQKNLLYNGAMQVAQRGILASSLTTGGYQTADRWLMSIGLNSGSWNQTVESDGPPGFAKSLKMARVSTGNSSDTLLYISQKLEGQDVQGLKKGTSEAEDFRVSFWAKSNVVGTYICQVYDTNNFRTVSQAYTITTVDTWEYKSLTFSGDTSGPIVSNNAASIEVRFWLAAGSNYAGGSLNTTWSAFVANQQATGQINVSLTVGGYWQMTGAMLSIGTTVGPFEHKAYGQELNECQRYYQQYESGGSDRTIMSGTMYQTGSPIFSLRYPVMRNAPTINFNTGTYDIVGPNVVTTGTSVSASNITTTTAQVGAGVGTSIAAGSGVLLRIDSGYYSMYSEL